MKTFLAVFVQLAVVFYEAIAQQIIQVSDTPLFTNTSPTGSLKGGAVFYIRGSGFDHMDNDNQVFIGSFPCVINDYFTSESFLVCQMPLANYGDTDVSLKVVVYIMGNPYTCSTESKCTVTLAFGRSPNLKAVIPQSIVAGTNVTLVGYFFSSSTDKIKQIKIGDYNCIIPEDMSKTLDSYNQYSSFNCYVSPDIPPNDYKMVVTASEGTGFSNAFASSLNFKVGYNQTSFNIRIHPSFQGISSNQGYVDGQILTLSGNGFGNDPSKLAVTFKDLNCKIRQVSNEKIQCELEKDLGSTVSTTYIGGAGLEHRLYNVFFYPNQLRTQTNYPNNNSPTINVTLTTENILGLTYYTQRMSGLFYAPNDGNYTFYLSSDDYSSVSISPSPYDPLKAYNETSLTEICKINGYTAFRYFYSYSTQRCTVTLQGNNYYYLLVIHDQGIGPDHFSLGVTIPNTDATLLNTKPAVKKVYIQNTPVREVISYKITKAISGTYKILFYAKDINNRVLVNASTGNITYNADAQTVVNAIRSATGYNIVGTRIRLDINDQETTVEADTVAYNYTLTFNSLRTPQPLTYLITTNLVGVAQWSANQITPPSAPIQGTFSLQMGTYKSPAISYSAGWDTVQRLLSQMTPLEKGVTVYDNGDPNDGKTWYIKMDSLKDNPDFTVVDSLITGGPTDAPAQVVVENSYEPPSNDLYFMPIPSELLYTFGSSPEIRIKVGTNYAACMSRNCTYTVLPASNSPVIESFTFNSQNLIITLATGYDTLPDNSLITQDNLSVKFSKSVCAITSVTLPTITCTMPTNSDGTLNIAAGSFLPKVHLANRGYFAATANPQQIALNINSLTPNAGSKGGNTPITLTGQGFSPETNVTVNGGPCIISSVSNIQIVCFTPAQNTTDDAATIVITEGTESKTFTGLYSYSSLLTPTITALSKASSSPVLKSTLDITVDNLGSNMADLDVILLGSRKDGSPFSLPCNPNSLVGNVLKCVLGGGPSGNYRIIINRKNIGNSIANPDDVNKFSYIITVTDVVPKIGSRGGGQVITITGTNFSTILNQNQVVINKIMCEIVSASSTQIQAIVPALPLSADTMTYDVYVVGRVVEEAVCDPSVCTFSYDNSVTPTVIDLTPTSGVAGTSITITGTKLNDPNIVIKLGNIAITTITAQNDTSVTFTSPVASAFRNQLSVLISGMGYANPSKEMFFENIFSVSDISVTSGSRGGAYLTINGNGFDASNATVKVGTANSCSITTISATSITCWFENLASYSTNYSVYVFQRGGNATCDACVFSSLALTNTPIISTISSTSFTTPDQISFIITGSLLGNGSTATVQLISRSNPKTKIDGTISNPSNNLMMTFTNVPVGTYKLVYNIANVGFAQITATTSDISVQFAISDFSSSPIQVSYVGGLSFTINGKGLLNAIDLASDAVTVCNNVAKVTSSSYNSLTFIIPQLVTQASNQLFNLVKDQKINPRNIMSSDNFGTAANVNDGNFTSYFSSSSNNCWISFDYGTNFTALISKIKVFPYMGVSASTLTGAKIEGSNDNVNWTTLITIPKDVVLNWNSYFPPVDAPNSWKYRYVRFSGNGCKLAEFSVFGIIAHNGGDGTSEMCDINISIGSKNITLIDQIEYRNDKTPTVTSLSPTLGTTAGGTVLTIAGTGFDPTTSTIFIDGILCPINQAQSSSTSLQCTTGKRSNFVEPSIVISTLNGFASIGNNSYLYIDRWSDTATWNGETPPREGDSVYVPVGQNLLIDISPPRIYSLIVEGSIVWEDVTDLEFHADFITVRGGTLQIGTEQNPHSHKLTITMYGTREGKQLPVTGNKNIAISGGRIDIHGTAKTPSWTLLNASVTAGASVITLVSPVNWSVGDEIVIASTSFSRDEFERRFITNIAADYQTLTLDKPLNYAHFAETLTYNGTTYDVRAEVAVLTRNVRVVGDPTTDQTHYGAHIMMMGRDNNLIGRFSNLEMTRCGQAFMMGRYPIHFHMVGNVIGSYIKNCSIHDSFNRGTTVHGVHFLTIMNNVYLNHMGHGIFIEDSIESNNVIEGNLVMRTATSASLLLSDLTPAGIWITRPKNFFRYNHVAGSTSFGFWFDLPGNPTGPSATNTICPSGEPLGQFHHNVAHTNGIGLRIYPIYVPRTNPCGGESSSSSFDPFALNPSVVAEITNNIFYANGQGFFGRHIGAIQLKSNAFICNGMGAAVAECDGTNLFVPRIEDSIFVGRVNSWYSLQGVQSGGAFHTPRRDGFLLKNVEFFDYPSNTVLFYTCEGCDDEKHRDIGARVTRFEKLKFTNVNAKMIHYNDASRDKDIFEDVDGSLLQKLGVASSTGGWVFPYFKYNDVSECGITVTDTNICSEKCLICDNSVKVRRVNFQMIDSLFDGLDMKVLNYQINNTMNVPDNFQVVKFRNVVVQGFKGWALPFVSSYKYNVHWTTGLDFRTMYLSNSLLFDNTDPGFYIRTNNTYQRELYDGAFYGFNSGVHTSYLNISTLATAPTTLNYFPDFFYTNATNTSIIRVDGNRIGTFGFTSVICRFYCPTEPVPVVVEENIRYWSNTTSWKNNKIPTAGDLVVIEDGWNMVLDVNTPLLEKLTIQGKLTFSTDPDSLTIRTKNIDITAGGTLKIGDSTNPYNKKATISLEADRTDPQIILDPIITPGIKSIVVKGKFLVYGQPKTPVNTRLRQQALRGSTVIFLNEVTNWAVGDELVISASSRNPTDVDYVKIVGKLTDSSFTVSPPLLYDHYGAITPIKTKGEKILDMRAEVSVLNRNVVIQGSTNNNFGCRILIPGYDNIMNTPVLRIQGTIDLNYAEVNYCGQKDSEEAALDFQGVTDNYQRVYGSSIRNGIAWGINMQSSQNIYIDNNIIANQTKTGVQLKNSKNVLFQNNVITQINNRTDYSNNELLDFIIGFYYNSENSLQQNNVTIRNNIISSTSWFSWAVPGYTCNQDSYNFFNNTGHSSRAGWFALKTNNECSRFSDFVAYWNFDEGFINRFLTRHVVVTRMLVADNNNGIAIYGGDMSASVFPEVNITHSEIYGQALRDCSFCYKTASSCSSSGLYTSLFEMKDFVFYYEEKKLPLHRTRTKDFLWGGHQNIISVNFSDFRTNDVCSNSYAIKGNNYIQDASAYVKLMYVNFTRVDYHNTIFFYNQTTSEFPGFCAMRSCTGIYNMLVADTTGGVFGSPKIFFGFNKPAAQDGSCLFEPAWNGHVCNPVFSLLTMQYPDSGRALVITPITLTLYNGTVENLSSDLQFTNIVDNADKIPMIVKKFGYHNVHIQGTMPNNAVYKLDSENPTDWAIFRIQHIDPSTMITLVNGVQKAPQIVSADETFDFSKSGCGDYVFFPSNRTIIWKMVAQESCVVKIQVIASLQLSLHINIAPTDFFKSGGPTTFLDRMAAILGIPMERIRIVGIFNGSTIVSCIILPAAEPASTTSTQPISHTEELQSIQDKFSAKVADGTLNVVGEIIGVSFSITAAPITTSANITDTGIVTVCRYISTKTFILMNIHSTEMNLNTVDVLCPGCVSVNQCSGQKLFDACNQNSTALNTLNCTRDVYCPSNCTIFSDYVYCANQNKENVLASMVDLCKSFCSESKPFNFEDYKSCNYTGCNLTCSSVSRLIITLMAAALILLI